MDAVLLARLQFALTIGFHFLFPAMTLGTSLIILISESLHLVREDEIYRRITDFCARLLGLIFVVERIVTVWKGGYKALAVAIPMVIEFAYDIFLQAVVIKSSFNIVFGRQADWYHPTDSAAAVAEGEPVSSSTPEMGDRALVSS